MKLWDIQHGDSETQKRDIGMKLAAEHSPDALQTARMAARAIAAGSWDHTCDIDRVRMKLREMDIDWGNWAGSVFKEKCWEEFGFKKCSHIGGRARRIIVWRLRR